MVDGLLEAWAGGLPIGFTGFPAASAVAQESTIVKFGTYSAKVEVQGGETSAAMRYTLPYGRIVKAFLKNYNSSDYKWTLSGEGVSEYYCELAAGGDPGIVLRTGSGRVVFLNGAVATEGSMGSLAAGQWDFGDNDSLGFSTLYVRTAGSTDPDAEATNYVQGQWDLPQLTVRAWAYKPETNGVNPRIAIRYADTGQTLSKSMTIPTDQWTPITATFYLDPSRTSAEVFFWAKISGGTPGELCYFDGIEIVEGTITSPVYDDSRGTEGNFRVGGTLLQAGAVGTMTGNETFTYTSGNQFIKDPGGAARTFNPSGSFPALTEITVINTADSAEAITFDSGTLGAVIRQNQRGTFLYTGSAWTVKSITNLAGDKQQFSFMQSDVAAAQAAVALDVLGLAGNTEYVLPYAGSVVGISIASNDARTAGTLTVDATIDGAVTGLQAILDAANTQYKATTQARELDTFAAGQRIGVKITTDAGWLPVTADIVVTVIVEM